MSKNAKVKAIVIQIGEAELSLKPDEARELMNVLKELLEPETPEPERTYIPYPYPYTVPYRWIETRPYWAVTYQGTTVGMYTISATSSGIE